jgi:hypothetical protein
MMCVCLAGIFLGISKGESMKQLIIIMAGALMLVSMSSFADDQNTLDQCIAAWGGKAPFKKGTQANKVVATGVKVFGIGNTNSGDAEVTDKPSLILLRPAVNVLGKSTIHLANPKGWYCFKSTVTVAGRINIEAHCDAHIASATGDGTSVLAANETDKGVAVLGALRVTRFGCADKKSK